jgi:TetR/AcrR family transcriptional regulator
VSTETLPLNREQQRQSTRGAVIHAAIRLFAARGFDGTSLPAVAEAAGIAVPLIIYHFKSKLLLWRAAVDAVYARIDLHLASHAPAIAAAVGIARYRAHIRAHLAALAAHPEYMRILFLEGMQASDRLDWLVATHQADATARLTALIAVAQADGLLPAMDVNHAKFILSGAFSLPIVLAAEYRLVDGTDALSPAFLERHIDACLALLMPGLAAAELA